MKLVSRWLSVALLLVWAQVAAAQTADEVIEKSLAAVGGRAAITKLKSRSTTGTITLMTPMGDIAGTIEILNAAPNKLRTLIKADLTSLGAGQLVIDQRFNGTSGYVINTLQGNQDITGNQLDNLRNNSFPHPFLNYKEMGMTAKLSGKEKHGDRDVYLVIFEPTSGSVVRQYIDAESYLPVKLVVKTFVPQLGQDIEQTSELLDYRDIDGVKLPYRLKVSSTAQNFTIEITKIEHNVPIDETLFSKPVAP